MAEDADHRANQQKSQEAWRRERPHYWTEYRRRHPDVAERNRRLQAKRDRKRRRTTSKTSVLAKMDALTVPILIDCALKNDELF